MDVYDYIKFFAAFALVMGLMAGLALLLKKLNLGNIGIAQDAKRRLNIIEVLPLDPRRKAVLIRRDDAEHLVILGPSGETVVETNIKAKNV